VRASFELGVPGAVSWGVYSAAGRAVRAADLGYRAAGPLAIDWDGRDGAGSEVRSGVYVLRIAAGGAALAEIEAVVR
jgi:flagellar hook assembly protein FlgD